MKRNKSFSLFVFLLIPGFVCAQLSTYKFKRRLAKTGKEDYYSITLQPELAAKCLAGSSDMRLYETREKDTLEIPYIYEWQGRNYEETREVPLELINISHDDRHSYGTIKFQDKRVIAEIKLDIAEENFDKYIELQGSNDNRSWQTIRVRARVIGINNGHAQYRYTSIRFQPSEYSYFRLVMDDSDSQRLSISHAYAYEPVSVKGEFTELKGNGSGFGRTENKENKTTEIIYEPGGKYRIAYIELFPGHGKDFYRNVNVYYVSSVTKAPKGDIENWSLLNASVLSSEENCIIDCYNTLAGKLKIEIMNNDDQTVNVEKIRGYAGNARLLAKLPASENIFLAYGKEGDGGPSYDLVHFAEKIPASPAVVTPGDEEKVKEETKQAPPSPLISNKVWLWTAMGGILLLLGFFSLRMLKGS